MLYKFVRSAVFPVGTISLPPETIRPFSTSTWLKVLTDVSSITRLSDPLVIKPITLSAALGKPVPPPRLIPVELRSPSLFASIKLE